MSPATFTVTVDNGRTSVRTQGSGCVPAEALDAAIEALQAERANVHKCPAQRARDSDGPRMAETASQARGEAGPARAEGIAKEQQHV